jgi:MFS family permease
MIVSAGLLREVKDVSGPRPDMVGAGLFTAGIAALTLALVKGPDWGWSGGRVLGLFATAAVLIAAVAVRCARHPAPLVEPMIARTRSVALANLGGLFFFSAFGAFLLGNVLFLTSVWHESVLRAGLQIAPGPLMAASFAFPGGLLGQRYGQRFVGAAGALLFASGALWMRLHMGTSPNYATDVLPAQLIGGIGVGLVLPTLSAAATAALPRERFATGTAVIGMSRQLGTALGIAVLIAILGHPSPTEVIGAFRNGWTFMIIATSVAAVALLSVGPLSIATAADPAPAVDDRSFAELPVLGEAA